MYGWGDLSDVSTIRVAEVPATPAIVTTSASGLDLVIDFTAPETNGEPIFAYEILIAQKDAKTFTEINHCDGST